LCLLDIFFSFIFTSNNSQKLNGKHDFNISLLWLFQKTTKKIIFIEVLTWMLRKKNFMILRYLISKMENGNILYWFCLTVWSVFVDFMCIKFSNVRWTFSKKKSHQFFFVGIKVSLLFSFFLTVWQLCVLFLERGVDCCNDLIYEMV
jgi:hypothetical protein